MESSSPDIRIEFGTGSPLTDITQWVMSDIQVGDEGIFIDGTVYGSTATVNKPVGVTDSPEIPLDMFYNDADGTPGDLFETISGVNTPAYTLRITLTAGSPATYAEKSVHIKSAPIKTKVKDVTRMTPVLISAGPWVMHRLGA